MAVSARYLGLAALLGLFFAVALFGGAATAKVYTNATHHYSITIPDNWTVDEREDSVGLYDPSAFVSQAMIQVVPNAEATSDPTFASSQAQLWCNEAQNDLNGEYAVEPRAIVTADGRPGGECVISATILGIDYTSRVSVFASAKYGLLYIITSTEIGEPSPAREEAYSSAAQSLVVEGDSPGISFSGAVLGLGLALILLFLFLGVRAMAAEAPPSGQGPPQSPPPPPL